MEFYCTVCYNGNKDGCLLESIECIQRDEQNVKVERSEVVQESFGAILVGDSGCCMNDDGDG